MVSISYTLFSPVNIQGKHIVNQNLYGYVKKYVDEIYRQKPENGKSSMQLRRKWVAIYRTWTKGYWLALGPKEYEQWRGKKISLKQQKPWKTKSSLSQLRILAILSWKRILKYPRLSPISERSQSSEERARHWLLDEMDLLCAKVTSIEQIDKDF